MWSTYFNPRSPWGERLFASCLFRMDAIFQSTLPVGGATAASVTLLAFMLISIHAPRGGSDLSVGFCPTCFYIHFNPRSPWGERPLPLTKSGWNEVFQSTLPVGGATPQQNISCRCNSNFNPRSPWGERLPPPTRLDTPPGFQSTLPVGGATVHRLYRKAIGFYFNPRSPWGERPSGKHPSH